MEKNFEKLGVKACYIKQLESRNIREAVDIQSKIIPVLASGESVFFTSETGTGKTFAYLLPALGKIHEKTENNAAIKTGVKILIISPTLELCTQIKGELDFLIKDTGLRGELATGSISLDHQTEKLKKNRPDIIVGTPNRILLLLRMRKIRLNLLYLIMDEADRLVSEELSDDTKELCRIAGNGGNPVFAACSATLNKKYREKLLSFCGLKEIRFVKSCDHEILREKIEHWAIFSEKRRKDQALRSLLAALKTKKGKKIKALVFTSRGDEAGLILSRLAYHRVPCAGLIGKINKKPLSVQERKAALDSFRRGGIEALVSTDLAARGLDIAGITHVIALDVPSDSEAYIHRCGRTGRAGKRGIMITIGDETQMRLLSLLEKKLKIKVQPKELHYGKVIAPLPIEE